MTVYSYSDELLTFVEEKGVLAKIVAGGILAGVIILFGLIQLNQSPGLVHGSSSVSALASENNILRQQLSVLSPRVARLEIQAGQLNERADEIQMLLRSRIVVVNTIPGFAKASKEFRLEFSVPAVNTSTRPIGAAALDQPWINKEKRLK